MNQIFQNTHFSPVEASPVFKPGEAVIIKEFRTPPIKVIENLDLAQHFSPKLMQVFAQIRTAAFTFAVDAATGYIHGVVAGKRGERRDAVSLVEMIMRDKTRWVETAYPMSMHCVPSVILVDPSNEAFLFEDLALFLKQVSCDLRTIASAEPEESLLDVLASQVRTRPVSTVRAPSFFDSRVAAGSLSSGALQKLSDHLTAVAGAYNHHPVDGRTPHEKMSEHELRTAPDAETMRLTFGKRKKRIVDEEGMITMYGIPYSARPGDASFLYAEPGEREVAVDHWDLSSVSVLADDGVWYEMKNALGLNLLNFSGWRSVLKAKFESGELTYSGFGLKEDYTFDCLDFMDDLGKVAEVVPSSERA